MKTLLLLATCIILVGCGRQSESHREVADKAEAGERDGAVSRESSLRWATANRREIESAVNEWTRNKIEDTKKSEALSPEVEEKIRQFEALQSELTRRQMESMRMRLPLPPGTGAASPDKEYEALANRVAEAKAPIADILDRRNRLASQYREQFATEKLIAEYAKDRFDLVVDSSDSRFSRSAVLYHKTGEVLDITDGVIRLFNEKAKP
jgi:hypothetical protein